VPGVGPRVMGRAAPGTRPEPRPRRRPARWRLLTVGWACYLEGMDGAHDLGGMHGFGAVVTPDGEAVFHESWEARMAALYLLVGIQHLGGGPSGRAIRESMPPVEYLAASYYERWLWSAERSLEHSGVLAPGEVERMMERLAAGEAVPTRRDPPLADRAVAAVGSSGPELPAAANPRFAPGDAVRVRRMRPARHTRCPRYVRGAVGRVERVQGVDALPELAAHGDPATPEPVYAVAFDSRTLWGDHGQPPWTVLVDLWEPYLEEVPSG
jgi:nitrile hydratase subunit beta